MIIACTSQTALDLPNQRVGVSRPAWVTWLIVRIVSVIVIVRIIAVGIVPVVWIRIVKERTSKIAKEEESIVEVAMVEPTVIPTSIAKCSGPRHAMGNARPSAVEARC